MVVQLWRYSNRNTEENLFSAMFCGVLPVQSFCRLENGKLRFFNMNDVTVATLWGVGTDDLVCILLQNIRKLVWTHTIHFLKVWNSSQICMSSLLRGHANLLCIICAFLSFPVQPVSRWEWTQFLLFGWWEEWPIKTYSVFTKAVSSTVGG